MKTLIIVSLLIFSIIASAEEELTLPTDIKPFFVHRTVKNAWNKLSHDGIYSYAVHRKGVVGPFVDIYIVENGKVIDKVGQGSSGKELMERIRKVGLKNFDYSKEVEQAITMLKKKYEKEGKKYFPTIVTGGQLYEIIYSLDGESIKFSVTNPGYKIYELSDHNENIGKLYSVYKELMLYYAERKFHFK